MPVGFSVPYLSPRKPTDSAMMEEPAPERNAPFAPASLAASTTGYSHGITCVVLHVLRVTSNDIIT